MAIKSKILAITLIMALFTCIAAPAVMGADVADNIQMGGGQQKKGEVFTIITIEGKNSTVMLTSEEKQGQGTLVFVTPDRVSVNTVGN